jgi:hypothetical protein
MNSVNVENAIAHERRRIHREVVAISDSTGHVEIGGRVYVDREKVLKAVNHED